MVVKILRHQHSTPPPATREVQWAPERHDTRPWETTGPIDWDPAFNPPTHRRMPYWDLDGEA